MPRAKTDPYYRDLVNRLVAAGRKSADVVRDVWATAERAGRKDAPGERTIRRFIADFKKLSPADQAEYGPVVWPDTFEDGLLPWEAARSVLDLVAYHYDVGKKPPTVKEARWWHRLRLASPTIPAKYGFLAGMFDAAERARGLGISGFRPRYRLTGFLAFQEWLSAAERERWLAYRRDSHDHEPDDPAGLSKEAYYAFQCMINPAFKERYPTLQSVMDEGDANAEARE